MTSLRRSVPRVVMVIALAAGVLSLAGTPAHAANLEQHRPVTYNMQGASADTTPKWSSDIPNLLTHDVIALQEAGPVPNANDPRSPFTYVGSVGTGAGTIYHFTRNFGTRSRPAIRHVYFMRTDPSGNPTNSGTRQVLFPPPGTPTAPVVRSACVSGTRPSGPCTGSRLAATTC